MGCVQEAVLPEAGEEGPSTEVALQLRVAGLTDATPLTKLGTVPENEPDEAVEIHNVWIVQFAGTTDAAKMARPPYYIADYTASSTVKLNTDVGGTSTLYFLANSYDPNLMLGTSGVTTLGQFKEKYLPVTEEASLFGHHSSKWYLRVSGFTTAEVNSGTTEVGWVNLYRTISRLDIYVKSSDGDITLDAVQLCNIPEYDYLWAPRTISAPFPKQVLEMLDYPKATYGSGEDAASLGRLFRYYVPANLRGTGAVTDPKLKGVEAPMGATYLRIDATYTHDAKSEQVRYYFYLGADFGGESGGTSTTDFNLKPNHKYTYNLEITQVGDPATDARVEYFTDVDFTGSSWERANSYMLHVPSDGSKSVQFKVPVEKADLFWNDSEYGRKPDTVDPSARDLFVREYGTSSFTAADMVLGASGAWTAEILWSDFDISSGEVTLVKSSGTGKDDYFQLQVQGGVSGNFAVGIKKTLHWVDGGKGTSGDLDCWLWSWHFWVTDYNPDQGSPSGYFYKVPGGKVMGLSGAAPYMMDRPIGATYDPNLPAFRTVSTAASASSEASLGLFYEYGRKDPFPNNRTIYYPRRGTSQAGITDIVPTGSSKNADAILASDREFSRVKLSLLKREATAFLYTENMTLNVPFSINHPLAYIYESTFWNLGAVAGEGYALETKDDRFNPISGDLSIIWQDPKAKDRTSLGDPLGKRKSVFDPCPPGWRINEASEILSAMGGWVHDEHLSSAAYQTPMGATYTYGAYIWPEARPANPSEGDYDRASLFVYEGYLNFGTGNLEGYYANANRQAHYWCSTPTGRTRAQSFDMAPGNYTGTESYRAQGYTIRCVKQY